MKTDGDFVGGAERARRDARKRRYHPRPQSSNPRFADNKRRRDTNCSIMPYPKSMREYMIDSSALYYRRQQLRFKNPRLMLALIKQSFNWRVLY